VVDARTVEGTDKAVYQRIIDEYGPDSAQAHVEVYGQFPNAGDDQFIGADIVDEAMKRTKYQDQCANCDWCRPRTVWGRCNGDRGAARAGYCEDYAAPGRRHHDGGGACDRGD
jgi:hypothetical protein